MSLATRFSKNLSLVVWARAVSVVVNLTFLGLCARTYGVVPFGQLVFVLATTSFLELIFSGSADSILVREQVRNPGDREENLRVCGLLHGLFSLAVIAASFAIALYFRRDWNVAFGLVFAGIASACQVLFCIPVAHFRSEQNMFFESVLITGERVFFLCGLLAVVVWKGPMIFMFACLMVSMAGKTAIAYVWLFRRVAVRAVRPARTKLRYFLAESLPLMGVTLLLSMHWRVDLFLMKMLGSAEQLGVYAAGFRSMEMLRIVPIDVITSAFPIFCTAAASQDGMILLDRAYRGLVRLALCAALLVTVVGVLFAPTAMHLLFGPAFAGAVLPLRILILAFPLIFWNQIDSITLTATGRQRWMLWSLVGTMGFQVLIDLVFIPRRGAAGAGVGFFVGEVALLAGTLLALKPLTIDLKQSIGTFVKLGAVAVLVGVLIGGLHRFSLLLGAILLLPAYALLLVLFKVVSHEEIFRLRAGVAEWFRSRTQSAPVVILQQSVGTILEHDTSAKS